MYGFDKWQVGMKSILICGICKKLCKDVTIIEECRHRFCKNCIMRKVKEENLKVCPECNTESGVSPLQKIRHDHQKEEEEKHAKEQEEEEEEGEEEEEEEEEEEQEEENVTSDEDYVPLPKGQRGRKKKEINIPPPSNSGGGDASGGGTNTNVAHIQVTTKTTGGKSSGNTRVVNERDHPIWFTLVACDKQEGPSPLPQISTRYIKIKDVNKPSSYLKKYLAQKLSLQSEDEVELRLLEMLIRPELPLKHLEKLWLCVGPHSGKRPVKVGASGEEFVMILKYSRSHPKWN